MSYSSASNSSFLNYNELAANDLKPGDLIEIHRGSYKHWAMFANKSDDDSHWCFHVTSIGGDFEKINAMKGASMTSAGSVSTLVAIIRKHKLRDILRDNDSTKPSQARINNKVQEALRKKCVPRPVHEVIDELEQLKDQTVRYDVKALNCEHYVTKWKYGAAWSRQVENATAVGLGVLAGFTFAAVSVIIASVFGAFHRSHKEDQDNDSDSD